MLKKFLLKKKICIRGLNKKLTFAKDIYYTTETIKDASNQGCKIPYLRNVQSLHSAIGVNLMPYPDKDLRLTIQNEYIFGHQIILGEVEYFSHLQWQHNYVRYPWCTNNQNTENKNKSKLREFNLTNYEL